MSAKKYLWISRWDEFQHYRPDPDLPPAWLKTYTKQLSDDRYRNLPPSTRGLLSDLRAEFARSRSVLEAERKQLSSRLGFTIYARQLKALNDAGFIEFLSREELDAALEKFYSRSRATRAREELERDKDKVQVKVKDTKRRGAAPAPAAENDDLPPLENDDLPPLDIPQLRLVDPTPPPFPDPTSDDWAHQEAIRLQVDTALRLAAHATRDRTGQDLT